MLSSQRQACTEPRSIQSAGKRIVGQLPKNDFSNQFKTFELTWRDDWIGSMLLKKSIESEELA